MPFRPHIRPSPLQGLPSHSRGRNNPPSYANQSRRHSEYPYSSSSHVDVDVQSLLPNLYVTLGGKQGLEKAVERFYEKLVTDPKLERFFSNVDLVLLKAHQHNLIRYALSTTTTTTPSLAPPSPSSASNSSASSSATPSSSIIKSSISITNSSSNDHEKHFRDFLLKRHERLFEMGLDETHLDRVVSHLEDTLREMHVSNQVIEQAKERLWPLRSMVFQAGAAPFQKQQEKRTHGPIDIYKPQFDRIYNTFVGRMTPFVIMITSTGVAILAIFWTLWDLPPPVSGMLVVPDWGQEV